MAAAGIKLMVHGQSLSVTQVSRFGVAPVVYAQQALTDEITLPHSIVADTELWYDEDTTGQQVTVVALQGDATALTGTVQTGPGHLVELDLMPSTSAVAADVARIDAAVAAAGIVELATVAGTYATIAMLNAVTTGAAAVYQTIAGADIAYVPKAREQMALTDSHTLVQANSGKLISVTSDSLLTVSVPPFSMSTGSNVSVYQAGTGPVAIGVIGTASLLAFDNRHTLSGQYAKADLNQPTPGVWLLTGDITTDA